MNFDVKGHRGAVDRSVTALKRDGQSARAVTHSRCYDSTVEDLWNAVTKGERIPRWFLPITGDLEPGGRYQLEGNAGGTITACERLSHFGLTWEFGGDVSWVDVRLSDDGPGRARLVLTHTALHLAHPTALKPDEMAFATSQDGKAMRGGKPQSWREGIPRRLAPRQFARPRSTPTNPPRIVEARPLLFQTESIAPRTDETEGAAA